MNIQVRDRPEPSSPVSVKTAIADCDIHPARATNEELYPFLAKRWHAHLETYGVHAYQGMMEGPPYPKAQPNASRRDAYPPEGGQQGSSLSFMQKQLLDPYNVALGVLNPLGATGQGMRNHDLAAALATAINDWQIAKWTSQDSRLKGSVVVANEDGVVRRRRNPPPRRRQELRPGAAAQPQRRAARPAPLLADLRGGRGGGAPGRRARLRLRRQSDHRIRLAEFLHRGDGRPFAVPADRAGQHRAGGRIRAVSETEDGDDRGRLRLGAVAVVAARQESSNGCTARCRI